MNNHAVSLFFCGDFCSKPSTSVIEVSEDLKNLINSCDLRICNFEVPLKPDNLPEKEDAFFQNADAPAFLEKIGFNLFSFASNHVFDYGEAGYMKTLSAFSNPESLFGSGYYDEAYRVKTVNIRGIKLGFLALCYAAKRGVFSDVSNKEELGCAFINDLSVNHIILKAKKEIDYLFILPHDGIEYIDVPLPETIARYRDFIDYGADAVIGTHPHCPQGWELYKNKPIFYSLGNFFFNSKKTPDYRAWNRPHWYEGLCTVLKIENNTIGFDVYNTKNENNLKITIDNSDYIKQHNKAISQYLIDYTEYERYLNSALDKLVKIENLNILHSAYEFYYKNIPLRSILKSFLKQIAYLPKIINKQPKTINDKRIYNLIKNDTRRQALLRILENG